VEGLGGEVGRLAEHVRAAGLRQQAFDAALREQEFLEELERVESEAIAGSPPDGEGLHDAVYGGLDPAGGPARTGAFDALFERHAARVPESRRASFMAGREHWREAGSRRLAAVQLARRREHERGALARIQARLLAGLRAAGPDGGADFEAARLQGLETIASMSDGEPARAALADAWESDVALAGLEARLRHDPAFAAKARALLGQD